MDGNENGIVPPLLFHSSRQQHLLIGYYLSRKKISKLRFEQFIHLCKHFHIDIVELTHDYFERSNARIPQLIIHKLEDDVISRSLSKQLRLLPKSSTIILDDFDSISKLMNRYEQYSLLNSQNRCYLVPPFVQVNRDDSQSITEQMLSRNQITFPVVCKPIQAHGEKSHDMKIIFDVPHLNDMAKPCVLQQFIEHNGVLFKVFAIGQDNYHVVQRHSIRNLHTHTSRETIAFHTSEVSSSQADHILLPTGKAMIINYDQGVIHQIVQTIQNLFQLNLIGIDIIIDRNTGEYAVIDVNYFPGYEDITDFSKQLFHLCQQLLHVS